MYVCIIYIYITYYIIYTYIHTILYIRIYIYIYVYVLCIDSHHSQTGNPVLDQPATGTPHWDASRLH